MNEKGIAITFNNFKVWTKMYPWEEYDEIKKYYTLEELIALYKKVNENEIRVKNLRLDEKALTNRLNNLNKKIEKGYH